MEFTNFIRVNMMKFEDDRGDDTRFVKMRVEANQSMRPTWSSYREKLGLGDDIKTKRRSRKTLVAMAMATLSLFASTDLRTMAWNSLD